MLNRISRRTGLLSITAAIAAPAAETAIPIADNFPAQPVDLVREAVTVSHGNFKRLKELVEARPALAKAAIDWGFGDWEDALGAASHVGNREIAQYLISKGARPTLYSATMLGQLDVVKAFIAANPGCQRIPGPHSISLLAHAKNGGAPAEPVLRYLESLGDAATPPSAPLTSDETAALLGTYVFGTGARDSIEITLSKTTLMFTRKGHFARPLTHLGDHAFHPAGASAVRIRFAGDKLIVQDPDPVIVAKKL